MREEREGSGEEERKGREKGESRKGGKERKWEGQGREGGTHSLYSFTRPYTTEVLTLNYKRTVEYHPPHLVYT